MNQRAQNGSGRGGARPIFLTPFGLYSRYMLFAYLRHTMMVSAALMTIALTIDLWPQVALFHGSPLDVMASLGRLAGWLHRPKMRQLIRLLPVKDRHRDCVAP